MFLLSGLFSKKERQRAKQFYGWAYAQAQQHCPKRFQNASKTKEDRREKFEAISFFMATVYYALLAQDQQKLARFAMEEMFDVFEVALREQGISDLKVAKEVRLLAGAFNGRLKAYEEGFEKQDAKALATTIVQNKAATKTEANKVAKAMLKGYEEVGRRLMENKEA